MDYSSAKIKINRWLIVLILGLTLGFSYEPPYIRYTFHEQLTNICGYTDTQLGLMLSVYGTVALIFYIIGGVSADKYSCRTLIVTSLLGTAFGCVVMAFYPPFWVALGVEALFVVTTIGLLWSPVYKVAAL
ncbi:MAG: MFS transporter, partial [Lachnospiraceae bacterium]|nr:MFS transporter [Lachnospiraceae bacterium]